MINTSKLVIIAALRVVLLGTLATVGSAPALAQALTHFGTALPRYYDAEGGQVWGSWAPPATDQKVTPLPHNLYLYVKPNRQHVTPLRKVR